MLVNFYLKINCKTFFICPPEFFLLNLFYVVILLQYAVAKLASVRKFSQTEISMASLLFNFNAVSLAVLGSIICKRECVSA